MRHGSVVCRSVVLTEESAQVGGYVPGCSSRVEAMSRMDDSRRGGV